MDRLLTILVGLAVAGVVWLLWCVVKCWLRRTIRVEQGALNDGRPTLLYFSSSDCAPCRLRQGPILASLRKTMGERVHFREYDAVTYPELANRYRVLTVPTTVIIGPGGSVLAVNYGVTQAAKLQRQLAQAGLELEG
jgi:thiol-disulfide isomerase/thioredoxin